jgi:hypothetical protein
VLTDQLGEISSNIFKKGRLLWNNCLRRPFFIESGSLVLSIQPFDFKQNNFFKNLFWVSLFFDF